MIQILQPCHVFQDDGQLCGDGCCWNAFWESVKYDSGDEIDDDDPRFDLSGLTEGEDYIRI
jgi:hypothetical protein